MEFSIMSSTFLNLLIIDIFKFASDNSNSWITYGSGFFFLVFDYLVMSLGMLGNFW